MARPRKKGLDYFPFDVDFFNDEKIIAIAGEFGLKGEITVVKLLCAIYRAGYYVEWNEVMKYKLVRELQGVSVELLQQIVERLVKWKFFDESLFEKGVLTSRDLQLKWVKLTQFVSKDFLDSDYNLIKDVKIPRYKLSTKARIYNRNVKKWHEIMKIVFKRDNYTCQYCGNKGGILEVDHIVPFSKGGSDELSNLATSCRHCNRQKRDKSIEEFLSWRKRNHE